MLVKSSNSTEMSKIECESLPNSLMLIFFTNLRVCIISLFSLKKMGPLFSFKNFLKIIYFASILHCNVHGSRVCVCTPMCCAVPNCSVVSNSLEPHGLYPPGSSVHGDSPSENTGVGCQARLWCIFLTQGSNLPLLHCSRILYL